MEIYRLRVREGQACIIQSMGREILKLQQEVAALTTVHHTAPVVEEQIATILSMIEVTTCLVDVAECEKAIVFAIDAEQQPRASKALNI